MEIGNPKNHMELINPSCSALSPNVSPSCGRIPARMAKVNAVVMSAKQLALNSADRLMLSVIGKGLGFGLRKQTIETVQNRKKKSVSFPVNKNL